LGLFGGVVRFFIFLLLLLPLLEFWVLFAVGQKVGILMILAMLIFSAFIGAGLLRYQGHSVLTNVRKKIAEGQLPAQEMLRGILVALAGFLFIVPGFLTDILALICLVVILPATWFGGAAVRVNPQSAKRSSSSVTLEGEYERIDQTTGEQ
jgi:UPF0716 protein FxsA